MARYTGPAWRISRRLIYSTLESNKEFGLKKSGAPRRKYAPGQHGQKRVKLSEYGTQMREKQKVRFIYGLSEKQLHNVFVKTTNLPGKHGTNFLLALESRLDNIVYRMGLAVTRRQARQFVNHGHILVDGRKVDIPSYQLKPGQKISVKERSRNLTAMKDALNAVPARKEYVTFDADRMEGVFARMPEREEFLNDIQDNLIVEFYNR